MAQKPTRELQQIVDHIMHLRVDVEINKAILGQLLVFLALNMPEPQKAIASLQEKVQNRFGMLPTDPRVAHLTKTRLEEFFGTIQMSLSKAAGEPGPQNTH